MDADDNLPLRSEIPIALLVREDLDRLSVAELHVRVTTLEAEILRMKRKIEGAVNHRASADALFKP